MAEKLKNIVHYQKPDFLEGLKKFTDLLIRKNMKVEDLRTVADKYDLSSGIIRRLLSYVCGWCGTLIYLNTHLNDLWRDYELVEWCQAFRVVLETNGLLDSRKFMYIRSADNRNENQEKIIRLLERYFSEVFGWEPTYSELQHYYNLWTVGAISNEEIYEVDTLLNEGRQTIQLPDFVAPKKSEEKISYSKLIARMKDTPTAIGRLNDLFHQTKLKTCVGCRMFGNPLVPIDGNISEDSEDIDVLIVNLVSSAEEAKQKQIFKEGGFVRQQIEMFPKGCRWLVVNLIPCAVRSKSEIGKTQDIRDQIKMCSAVLEETIGRLKPKVSLLVGEEVFQTYLGVGSAAAKFKDSLGKILEGQYIGLPGPAGMRGPQLQQLGKEAWASALHHVFSAAAPPPPPQEEEKETKNNPPPEKPKKQPKKKAVDPTKEDLLLLDVRELSDGDILLIYTDSEGNKVYDRRKNLQTAYVKNKDFKECNIITSEVDFEFQMNRGQKIKLNALLRKKMAELKGGN